MKIKDFNEIMNDMLSMIPDDFDKTEGSIIYDALAPAALELNAMYMLASDILKLGFVKTSEAEYLTELAFQFGINRLPATKAVRSANFSLDIEVGTRFSITDSEINFVVIEKRTDDYLLECETAGVIGNEVEGNLLPIDYINNLKATKIGVVIIPGEEEESDESLRERTLTHIQRPEQDGNIYQYLKWASEFAGIGNASVLPLWNGPNTVKVIITDSEGNTASPELVRKFQDFLDPGIDGKGEGKAPIGAIVTVASAETQVINIKMNLTFNDDYNVETSTTSVVNALNEYVKKATTQKAFKKYEVATLIDALKEIDYIVKIESPENDIEVLRDASIFTLGKVTINDVLVGG